MTEAQSLKDELQALRNEITDLLKMKSNDVRASTDAFASQIKSALKDLGYTVRREEARIENAVSDRPIATLSSAFAIGVLIGAMLGRHR